MFKENFLRHVFSFCTSILRFILRARGDAGASSLSSSSIGPLVSFNERCMRCDDPSLARSIATSTALFCIRLRFRAASRDGDRAIGWGDCDRLRLSLSDSPESPLVALSPPKSNAVLAAATGEENTLFLLRFFRSRDVCEDGDRCSPLVCAAICDALPSIPTPKCD